MTRRTRRALFYGLVALFFVLGAFITLYAQGWRMDLRTFKTEKVGAIFVRSYPGNASIALDGKDVRNTSGFLSHGTLISDLFPKNYDLTLSAPGYLPWTESAPVSPTLVTEMKYAVLVPAQASSAAPAAGVTGFFEAGGNVVTVNTHGTIAAWRAGQQQAAAIGARSLAGVGSSANAIGAGSLAAHATDFSTIVIKSSSGKYLAYDLAASTSTNVSALLSSLKVSSDTISSILVNPFESAQIIAETPSALYSVDLRARKASVLATVAVGNTLEQPLALSSSWIAWAEYTNASKSSNIVIYDPFSQNVIDASLILPGHVRDIQWIRSTMLGVLDENGQLYRYDIPSETKTAVADDVRSFTVTADGSTLATLESRSIEIFSLLSSNTEDGYYRFNPADIAAARSIMWYSDGTHLFINYPSHVNFLDLADLSLRNFATISALATDTTPVYDVQGNSLYVIDQGNSLIRFDFPH